VLVGFGGAGPGHANALARDAEIPTVLVPPSPGIFSATGLLTTDLKRDAAQTVMQRLDTLDEREVEAVFVRLEADGAEEMRREGVPEASIEFVRRLDLRYVGQSYELTVDADDDLAARFHAEHDRVYGFSAETEPIECVSLRLTTVCRIAKPPPRSLAAGGAGEPKAERQVYFAEADGYVDCPIYDRYALGAGARLVGPAIVEEFDSTTVVHPGYAVHVDEHANLIIEREDA